MKPTMTKITTLSISNRTFAIVHDEHGFWGIEDKYIDAEGKLAVQLNGVSGFLHDTLQGTLDAIRFQVRFDELLQQGLSFGEAAQLMLAN